MGSLKELQDTLIENTERLMERKREMDIVTTVCIVVLLVSLIYPLQCLQESTSKLGDQVLRGFELSEEARVRWIRNHDPKHRALCQVRWLIVKTIDFCIYSYNL